MAFDPDAFIAGKEQSVPEVAEPTDKKSKFNPNDFIKNSPDYVATSEPKMVAETEVIKEQPPLSALPAYVMTGTTGLQELGQTAKAAVSPYGQGITQGLKNTADIYKARPIVAPLIDAIGLGTVGVPPIAAGQQALGAYDKYNAIKQGVSGVSQELSKGEQTRQAYNAMNRALYANDPTNFRSEIKKTYGPPTNAGVPPGPGNNAVRSMLNSPAGQAAMAANPQFAAAAQAYLNTVPTYGQQAMKVVAPLARGALKVAGPVGMAYNMYEAQPYLAQAGPELNSGRAQDRIRQAQQMNPGYGAPISPQEEQNVMASGSQRDIQALIRKKAAERVLGPIAPQ